MLSDVFRRAASLAALSLSAVLLSACGGGGGGGSPATSAAVGVSSTGVALAAADSVANICTDAGQKQWVRSFMGEKYLWHDEIRDVESGNYSTPNAYFDALLVKTNDENGVVKDRFSISMGSTAANLMQGVAAAAAGGGSAADPVPLSKIVSSGAGRRVGYILFNEHKQGALDKLAAAVTQLRDGAVQDLVLDLRYNAGGFLYVAQSLGAMVAGAAADGQVYEQLLYSDKRAASNETMLFSSRVTSSETNYTVGMQLPQLGLPRLYVLTSRLTCSASETIINSLRGIGVQVVLVGDRTCGKPYGFHRKDNCGQAYFPVEFKVANAAGFADYSAGLPVQCKVAEDPRKALGDTNEPLLAAALRHIDTGNCPAAAANAAGVMVEQASPSPLERAGAPAADSPMYQQGFNGLLR